MTRSRRQQPGREAGPRRGLRQGRVHRVHGRGHRWRAQALLGRRSRVERAGKTISLKITTNSYTRSAPEPANSAHRNLMNELARACGPSRRERVVAVGLASRLWTRGRGVGARHTTRQRSSPKVPGRVASRSTALACFVVRGAAEVRPRHQVAVAARLVVKVAASPPGRPIATLWPTCPLEGGPERGLSGSTVS